jgi:acetoin utilization deacetylase AcuC-like enzyme
METILLPAATRFQPDLIMISAGFDSRIGDPLGQFTLEDEDFRDMTRLLLELAERTCEGRLVSVQEGGYSLPGLVSAAETHICSLASSI